MTDTTDIKALRPAERANLGFVTDDNTGGYYVAECEECGQIFPSQTCDGGEQIADSGDYGDCYCPHCGFIDPLECDNANLVWNVQQLKIVNLTKQLEAERQRADDEAALNKHLDLAIRQSEGVNANLRRLAEKANAEPAALKGEQVPVVFTAARWLDTRCKLSVWTDRESAVMEIGDNSKVAELYDHPQKPVVLPIDEMSYRDACEFVSINGMRNEDRPTLAMRAWNSCRKAAIEAAGGIVKDGE